jgi:hypothetical protein
MSKNHPQNGTPKKQVRPSAPWRGKELPHFWALVRKAGMGKEDIAGMTAARYKKDRLSDLTRHQWLEMLWHFRRAADPEYACSDEQWERIKWLQHELGWTDAHLENYIKKFGRIDRIEWLCGVTATKIMVALQKIIDWQGRRANESSSEDSGENRGPGDQAERVPNVAMAGRPAEAGETAAGAPVRE